MLATSTGVLFVPIEILPRATLLVMKIKPLWHCQMLFFYVWNLFKSPDFGIRECWTLMPCWWLASCSCVTCISEAEQTPWGVVQGCLSDILRPWEILQKREESRGRRPRIAEPKVNLGAVVGQGFNSSLSLLSFDKLIFRIYSTSPVIFLLSLFLPTSLPKELSLRSWAISL